jgi:hypothetical protein
MDVYTIDIKTVGPYSPIVPTKFALVSNRSKFSAPKLLDQIQAQKETYGGLWCSCQIGDAYIDAYIDLFINLTRTRKGQTSEESERTRASFTSRNTFPSSHSTVMPIGQCCQPSRPSDITENGTGRLLAVRPERGRNGAVFLRPDGDGRKDGRRRRSLSANNKNYTKIISITILTVMQDLGASVPSILFLTPVSSKITPSAPRISYIPKPV